MGKLHEEYKILLLNCPFHHCLGFRNRGRARMDPWHVNVYNANGERYSVPSTMITQDVDVDTYHFKFRITAPPPPSYSYQTVSPYSYSKSSISPHPLIHISTSCCRWWYKKVGEVECGVRRLQRVSAPFVEDA